MSLPPEPLLQWTSRPMWHADLWGLQEVWDVGRRRLLRAGGPGHRRRRRGEPGGGGHHGEGGRTAGPRGRAPHAHWRHADPEGSTAITVLLSSINQSINQSSNQTWTYLLIKRWIKLKQLSYPILLGKSGMELEHVHSECNVCPKKKYKFGEKTRQIDSTLWGGLCSDIRCEVRSTILKWQAPESNPL